MATNLQIQVAKEKATMLSLTKGCNSVEEVKERIEEFYADVLEFATELENKN